MAFNFGTTYPSLPKKPTTTPAPQPPSMFPPTGPFLPTPNLPPIPAAPVTPPPQPQNGIDFNQLLQHLQAPAAPAMDLPALIQALNAPRGHHYGIGGAEISPQNPMGNPGGDPFTNGFFKPQAPVPNMNYLVGSPNPDQGQQALLAAANAPTPDRPWVMPQGDPQARAFWSMMGQKR